MMEVETITEINFSRKIIAVMVNLCHSMDTDKKVFPVKTIEFLAVIAIGISLPLTMFLVYRQEDIRQRAAQSSITPTQEVTQGCPAINADGTKNVCRNTAYCQP